MERITRVDLYDSFEIFASQVERIPFFDETRKQELLLAARNGDEEAAKAIIESHLLIGIEVIKRLNKYGLGFLPDQDLIETVYHALGRCIKNYRGRMYAGASFETYARQDIEHRVRRIIKQKLKSHIELPASLDVSYEDGKGDPYSLSDFIADKKIKNPALAAEEKIDGEYYEVIVSNLLGTLEVEDREFIMAFYHISRNGNSELSIKELQVRYKLKRKSLYARKDRILARLRPRIQRVLSNPFCSN